MKLLAEIIDFKITFLYSFMLLFFNFVDMEKGLKLFTAVIFVGYNLHRWYIMHQADKREKAKHKSRNRRS